MLTFLLESTSYSGSGMGMCLRSFNTVIMHEGRFSLASRTEFPALCSQTASDISDFKPVNERSDMSTSAVKQCQRHVGLYVN